MNQKILLVDDEINVLSGYQRTLRAHFEVLTASSGTAALALLEQDPAITTLVTDMHMPVMNGLQLLSKARQLRPSVTRVMLTGQGDLKLAIEALAKGSVFRFLTKPCSPEAMKATLEDAVRQWQLLQAEQELLEKTLHGSIQVLTEILSLSDPKVFGRRTTLRDRIRAVGLKLGRTDLWHLEVAAMLAPIGYFAVPQSVVLRAQKEQNLSVPERDMLLRVPEMGSRLLRAIPRLETVADAILYQRKNFDGTGFPGDEISGELLPMGARLLRILSDLEEAEAEQGGVVKAIAVLRQRKGHYDTNLLDLIEQVLAPQSTAAGLGSWRPQEITVEELHIGQVTACDILTTDGAILVRNGNTITQALMDRLRNFSETVGIKPPILIRDVVTPVSST